MFWFRRHSCEKQVKTFNYHKTEATPVFVQRFFKIQNFSFASPSVLYTCQSRSSLFQAPR